MATMGAHGDGGISPTGDGRLAVRLTMSDGKRITRMVPARLVRSDPKAAKREADRLLRELREARDLDLDPSRQTVAAYLRSWIASLRDAKHQRLRPKTLAGYTMIVEQHVIPAFGDSLPLGRLSKRRIQAWVDGMDGSPQSVENRYAVLRKALNGAAGDLIARNPALGVELPEPSGFSGEPLTFDEARALLAATRDDWLGPLWRLALTTGLRQGELLALAWVNLAGDMLRVEAQLQRLNRGWAFGPTKAARSLTVLTLDAPTVAVLEEHRKRMAAARTPDWRYFGLLFVTAKGEPYHGADVLRAFHAACDAAGIRRRRFHDLRATTATLMREIGVSEDTRMSRLGHATRDMARHYGKASAEQDRLAVDMLAEALG